MRDESHLDYPDVDAPPRRSRWAVALGGVAALALLAGAVVWTYRLGVRDPQDVPVIRAATGGHKARPEDPGGATFAHQGMGIYAAMRGETPGAGPGAAGMAFAPPPEPLAPEDEPAAALAGQDMAPPVAPIPEGPSEIDLLVAAVQAGLGVSADAPEAPPPAPPAVGEALPEAPVSVRAAPPRPAPPAPTGTPAGTARATAAAPSPAGAPQAVAAVQLGAYLSEDAARTMWGEIRRRTGDLLGGREPAFAAIPRGDRMLVGLRTVGFADAEEARALCAALKARGEECFVTLP